MAGRNSLGQKTGKEWIEEYAESEQMITTDNPGATFNINMFLLMTLLFEKLGIADAVLQEKLQELEDFLRAPNAYLQVEQWWSEWIEEGTTPENESSLKIPLRFSAIYNQMIYAFKTNLEMYSLPEDV